MNGAPFGGIDPLALIGRPPQHRDHRQVGGIYPAIHPTALIEAFAQVDSGTFRPTTIGARTWLMKLVHVGHDTIIGKDCEISVGVGFGGGCEVGDRVRIGVGASFRPYVKVGDGARIGVGAAVVKDVPANECWAGNPAKKLYDLCPACGERVAAPGDYCSTECVQRATFG